VDPAQSILEIVMQLANEISVARVVIELLLETPPAERDAKVLIASSESLLCIRECLLRVRAAAVQIELARLQRVEHEAPPHLFGSRFSGVLALSRFVLDLVGRINASLARERRAVDDARLSSATRAAHRARYEVMLAKGEWAYGVIGKDPDVARVLADGGRAGSERFRSSCQMLAVLLSDWTASPDTIAHALEALASSPVGQAEVVGGSRSEL
jgi:hypothetical protein